MRTIRLNVPKQKELPEVIAQKILTFLEGLKIIDETEFSSWYEQGWSKKEALEKKVLLEAEFLINRVKKNWDNKFPELGTHFSFWSGKNDDVFNSSISFNLGKTIKNPNLKANVILEIPIETNAPTLDDEKVKEIISLMQETWGKHPYDVF